MTFVYRLLRQPFASTPFDGEGSFGYGGRWWASGTRIVYTAEHLSLAMVEYLVHLDSDQSPRDLVLARAEVPDDIPRRHLQIDDLPKGWQDYPAPQSLAVIGETFVRENQAAVLIIPSVVAPAENNWLLNPNHPDFQKITLGHAEPFRYDPRLLRDKSEIK